MLKRLSTKHIQKNFKTNDRIEQKILPFNEQIQKIATELRARLVHKNPNASDAEIDAMVLLRVNAGSAPTSEVTPPSTAMNATILDERKKARLAVKRKGRQLRKP